MLDNFWAQLRTILKRSKLRTREERQRRTKRRTLWSEELERRCMLSVSQVYQEVGTSKVVIVGTAADDRVTAYIDGSNQIHVSADTGNEHGEFVFARAGITEIAFHGNDGNDQLVNLTDIEGYMHGDGGNDTLIGGSAGDEIYGGTGNDFIDGQGGDDDLQGEAGNDYITGGVGNDQILGGDGDDQILGGDGNDYIAGENGNDSLQGLAGNDTMFGGIGKDRILGGDGDDLLYGNEDDDYLAGENGNDELQGLAGNDTLIGDAGNDRLLGGDGNDLLLGNNGDDYLAGEAGNDELQGMAGNDILNGDAGNDRLLGGDGDDHLFGYDGDDYLAGQDGNDELQGMAGNDTLLGDAGNDRLLGGDGDDHLYGYDGDDYLSGDAGNDELQGLAGNDELIGGIGNDRLLGGDGDDQLYGNEGDDYLAGENGNDELQGLDGNDTLIGDAGNDRLLGGNGDDVLLGNNGDDYLAGEAGNDELQGMAGNDVLTGDIGNDRLLGGDGDDQLFGYDGDDYLAGEEGNDELQGLAGNDTLIGDNGNDRLLGGDGDDMLLGNNGDDYLAGEAGNDVLHGLAGNDTLIGDVGSDVLLGEDGNDQLVGNDGDDVLVGGTGDDSLVAGNGNDILIGGMGVDQLSGEDGSDVLIGGITNYDADLTALRVLQAAWASALPYATRVSTIKDELFAAHLESQETVFDDQVADTLFGGAAQDWFIETGYVAVWNAANLDPGMLMPTDMAGGHSHTNVIVDTKPQLEGFSLIDSIDKLTDRGSDETLDSLLPHADSPTLQREHLALLQIVRYSDVTNIAVKSGAWSNPATWQNGVVPGNDSHVLIPIGIEIQVDGMIPARLATIRVDGKLTFATDRNTELKVDTLVATSTSRFEMGTESQPVAAGVTAHLLITDNGAIDRARDPFGIGRGFISHGSVSMVGASVNSHAVIVTTVPAGTTQITIDTTPAGWKVGDTIVIAGTSQGTSQNEVRQITKIVGSKVTLNQPLAVSHNLQNAGVAVSVGLLTRNVVVESEATVVARQGHVMFMHDRDVDIAFAEFIRLGRTDKTQPINDAVVLADWTLKPGTGTNPRGRYAVHFHRNGTTNDGNPASVRGSSVVDSGSWAFVNHSSYVDISDNVSYAATGAAFVTEVGNEIGSFENNLAIGTVGSGEDIESRKTIQDFGHQGDGFWFQGTGITVTDNVAAGNAGNGFVYYARGLVEGGVTQQFLSANLKDPSIANGATMIPVGSVPILEFNENTAYASSLAGLNAEYLDETATHTVPSIIQNSTFVNNGQGIDLSYSRQTILRDLSVIDTTGTFPRVGVGMNNITSDITYQRLTVSGFQRGIELAERGYSIVDGGHFSNQQDLMILTAFGANRSVYITNLDSQPIVVMGLNFNPFGGTYDHVFYKDTVTLNYGPYHNQQLFYAMQALLAVPFPVPLAGLPSQYVGLTNQQLMASYGLAVGGQIAPFNAIVVPFVSGLLAPA